MEHPRLLVTDCEFGLNARSPSLKTVGSNTGTSTLLAAWNAAVYVAQIEDVRLNEMLQSGDYLQATKNVLQRHGGLWFQDESFVVVRVAEELSAGNSTKPYLRLANND